MPAGCSSSSRQDIRGAAPNVQAPGAVRALLSRGLALYRRAVFLRWTMLMRLRLAWWGMRLDLDAPEGALLTGAPGLEVETSGRRGGTLRLTIGRGVRIGSGTEIQVHAGLDSSLELGDRVRVSSGARFKLRGGAVRIGPGTAVRDFTVLKSAGELVVGACNTLSYGVVIHCDRSVTLGDGVGLAERTTIVDSQHEAAGRDVSWSEQPVVSAPVVLGRNTTVFANAAVLKGTVTGPGCVAAANSVLRGEYPPNSLLVGAPAQVVRTRSDADGS